MSETKHTPGPWHLFEPLDSGAQHSIGYWIPGKDERFWLASIYPVSEVPHKFKPHCEQAEANARLIAAAPDLLAALRMGVELSERNGNGGSESQAFRHLARLALARAEGGAE